MSPQLAQSLVEVSYSDNEPSDSVAAAAPAAQVPVTPRPPTPAVAAIKQEHLCDAATLSPLGDRADTCKPSLTYAIAMTAMGLNDGSKTVDELHAVYLGAKTGARNKGKSPVSRLKAL